MIRVGLGRTEKSYAGLAPPYGPGEAYPELAPLLGDAAAGGAPNHVYAGVRAALRGLGLDADRFGTAAWNPLGDCVARGRRVVLKPNFIRHWNPAEDASIDSRHHPRLDPARRGRLRVPRRGHARARS